MLACLAATNLLSLSLSLTKMQGDMSKLSMAELLLLFSVPRGA